MGQLAYAEGREEALHCVRVPSESTVSELCVQVQIAALRTARTRTERRYEGDAAQVTLAIRPPTLPLHSHRPTARSSDAIPSESILVSTSGRLQQTVRRHKGQMVERMREGVLAFDCSLVLVSRWSDGQKDRKVPQPL